MVVMSHVFTYAFAVASTVACKYELRVLNITMATITIGNPAFRNFATFLRGRRRELWLLCT